MTFEEQIHQKLDTKTKPPGSLGGLESLAKQIALAQGTTRPELRNPTLLVYAADHGITREPVSAYPREVTAAMVMNFLNGGAAINVFTRLNGMALKVYDVGVDAELPPHPALGAAKVASGTANMLEAPAMTEEHWRQCLVQSAAQVEEAAASGCNVIGFGEMGIGNTSSAALLMHGITGLPLSDCVGAGTGVTGPALERKLAILQRVLNARGTSDTAAGWMQSVGGFEIAHMAGGMAAAARRGMLVLVDGFIATAAYAAALELEPALPGFAVFCHCSDEKGHRLFLEQLGAHPLLDLGLRLGEGTGCALALPLLRAATAFLNEMASFDQAGVPTKPL